jgi:uncharacterized protein YjiS (DUF1127 family)
MDTDLMHKGLVELEPGELLRLREATGRHVGVVRGSVWITQDGDPADRVIGSGESFRFDRDGLAIVAPLGAGAKLVLEEGLAPQKAAEAELALIDWDGFLDRMPEYERRAHRLRADAMADLLLSLAGALKRGWGALRSTLASALAARRTAHELRGLSDHFLKDVGLRRDQIGCITRTIPC